MRPAARLKLSGEPRHLVVALDLHARGEVAGAERFDSGLQALQPPGQTAHHGIGADPDGERDQREREEQGEARMAAVVRDARDQQSAVGQMDRPARGGGPRQGRSQRPRSRPGSGAGKGSPTAASSVRSGANSDTSASRLAASRTSAACCSALGAHAGGSTFCASAPATSNACSAGTGGPELAPEDARREREGGQAREHREIDAQVELAHQSCCRANT